MKRRLSQMGWILGWAAVLTLGGSDQRLPPLLPAAQAQAPNTITLRSDVQEANTNTGIITARGNVQIDYPAQQIRATSAQADYYSNERRIVLSGNVLIDQQGSTIQAEVVTYLIDEGRFVALPNPSEQVETIYLLPNEASSTRPGGTAPGQGPLPAPRPPVILEVDPIN